MDKIFLAWYLSQSCPSLILSKWSMHLCTTIFLLMYLNREFFEHQRFTRKGRKIMKWPPSSSDLNPIENLWSIVQMKLYESSKQYNSKVDLWKAVKTSVVFWPSTRPKMPFKVMHRKEVTHSNGSYERKSRWWARLIIWDKVKVPLQSDAPEESDLWTAWQLFPLDDDQTCHSKDWVGDRVAL